MDVAGRLPVLDALLLGNSPPAICGANYRDRLAFQAAHIDPLLPTFVSLIFLSAHQRSQIFRAAFPGYPPLACASAFNALDANKNHCVTGTDLVSEAISLASQESGTCQFAPPQRGKENSTSDAQWFRAGIGQFEFSMPFLPRPSEALPCPPTSPRPSPPFPEAKGVLGTLNLRPRRQVLATHADGIGFASGTRRWKPETYPGIGRPQAQEPLPANHRAASNSNGRLIALAWPTIDIAGTGITGLFLAASQPNANRREHP